MSFHEGSNYQALREDQGKKLFDTTKAEPLTRKELNAQQFAPMRPNLFILRASKGLSSRECDDLILKTTVKRWEQLEARTGVPDLKEMMLISEFFGVPINDILYKKYKIIFE